MFTLRMARKWVVRFVFLESGCYWWMNSGKHWETIFTLSFDNSTSLLGSTIKFSDSVTMKSLQLPIFVGHKNRPSRVRPLTSQQLGKLRAAAMVAVSSAAEALERIGESAWQRTKHSLKRRTLQPKMGICLERPCHSTEAAWGWKKCPWNSIWNLKKCTARNSSSDSISWIFTSMKSIYYTPVHMTQSGFAGHSRWAILGGWDSKLMPWAPTSPWNFHTNL